MISRMKNFFKKLYDKMKTIFTKENVKHFIKNCPLKKFENFLLFVNTIVFLAGAFFLYQESLFLALFTFFLLACMYPFFLLKPYLKKKAVEESAIEAKTDVAPAQVQSLSGSRGEDALLEEMYALNKEEETTTISFEEYQALNTKYQQALEELKDFREQLSKQNFLQESLLPSYPEAEVNSYDLIAFVHKITLQFNPTLFKKRIFFEILYDDEILLTDVNMECFSLILRNCMDNAVKHLTPGGKLVITISENDGDALIVLKDNGNGLLIQDTDMLFRLNYQGSNHVSGTGLGLAQAKAATTACGGDIWCKTSPDKGFAIYIKLPVCTRVPKQQKQ